MLILLKGKGFVALANVDASIVETPGDRIPGNLVENVDGVNPDIIVVGKATGKKESIEGSPQRFPVYEATAE